MNQATHAPDYASTLKPSAGLSADEVRRIVARVTDRVARSESDRRTLERLRDAFFIRATNSAARTLRDRLGLAAAGFAVGPDASGDAVLGGEFEQLVEDLLDDVVGLHAREVERGAAVVERDAHAG